MYNYCWKSLLKDNKLLVHCAINDYPSIDVILALNAVESVKFMLMVKWGIYICCNHL